MSVARVAGIDHVNLCTSADRLDRVARFYVDAIGLTLGLRPASSQPGLWLCAGEQVVIHVSAKAPASEEGASQGERPARGFDHIAFRTTGGASYRERLRALHIGFSESKRPTSYQILLTDPDGTRIELNFDPAEAA